jgi:predicted nucleic acid-binding protein
VSALADLTSFLPDTSCMVAAVMSWHEHHERARAEIEKRLGRMETMVIAGPALIETYSVLTRLPAPHRLSAVDARALLQANFLDSVEVVVLSAAAYRSLIKEAPESGIAGGRTYDAVIAECARKAGAAALLTFNDKHFSVFGSQSLQIVAL